jgi:hypothetical protein
MMNYGSKIEEINIVPAQALGPNVVQVERHAIEKENQG